MCIPAVPHAKVRMLVATSCDCYVLTAGETTT